MKKKTNPLLKWWVTPKLVDEYVFERKSLLLKYFIHPVKRRAAKYYLIFLRKIFGLKVIGITGSAGKTTTKEMLASILSKNGKTVASFANIDPVYNIPTSIFKCTPFTKYLILEMGVEYKNEMDFYFWLALPDIGVVLNVYPTHTLFFENIGGVYKEKKKMATLLDKSSTVVLNKEDEWVRKMSKDTSTKIVWFGKGANIHAENIKTNEIYKTTFDLQLGKNKTKVTLKIPGKMFIDNALAAATTAHVLGLNRQMIKQGLESFEMQDHRMNIIKTNKYVVIDESYNSNPKALEASLETFSSMAGGKIKIAVLGDMLELGVLEEEEHKKVGKNLKNKGVDYLIAVGKASKIMAKEGAGVLGKSNVFWVSSASDVKRVFEKLPTKDSFVLVKGSRSIGLEKFVSEIT